jgi:7,8-dihydropterin-6-yl-methyl-4-(beta-D-ribofuranosyl)aminobenzene 5'-phosphate synthase
MELRITILCDNFAGAIPQIIGEHGFAAFIEREGENYLFDTSQGIGLTNNALVLEKDLRAIKKVFLSHGHRDHTGGLLSLVKICPGLEVFAHPDVFLHRFSIRNVNGKEVKRPIGAQFSLQDLLKLGACVQLSRDFLQLGEGLFLTGEIPRVIPFEKGDTQLYKEEKNRLDSDPVFDDQSLIFKTTKGLVVLFGCAHSGLINILHHINEQFPKDRIHAILGGTHLGFLNADQRWRTIEALQDFDFDKIGPAHCTGQQAACELYQAFPDKFFFTHVGSVFEV